MNERRTAADFVAAVCGLSYSAPNERAVLTQAAASVRGPGAEDLRLAVGGEDLKAVAPDKFEELATRWSAPCLASLAVAMRLDTPHRAGIGAMRDYLEACAVADATGTGGPQPKL